MNQSPPNTPNAHNAQNPPKSTVGQKTVSGNKKWSVRVAIVLRFVLIIICLLVFITQIFVALTNTRAVKELVAQENEKKIMYYQQALTDIENANNYIKQANGCDEVILKMEEDLDGTISTVTISCCLTVVIMAITTVNTLLYIKYQVVDPLILFRGEAEKLAKGDLKLDFTSESRGEEVYALGFALQESIQELTRIVTVINIGVTELSNKNFQELPPCDFPGDFFPIEKGFRELVVIVADTLREIVYSAEEVNSNANHVSAGAQTLAQGATEQASSVDHLSETISEIAKMVADTAQSAEEANQLGAHTSEVLEISFKEMSELMEAITQIERSSSDIEQIIKTIDDIAFQTNILALNAAIEAARAGHSGKSFAVVADEVRTLAQKSADAARDTGKLIGGSLEAIHRGATLAKSTNAAFADVKDSSEKILDVVHHIADSSKHQSDSIEDICQSVSEISNVISNNSTTSEESASASEQLSGQASIMHDMLGTFQISGKIYREADNHLLTSKKCK
ncbi:MAG: methyl-accepting chemotaxis protein [Eubacteriales bacterium]